MRKIRNFIIEGDKITPMSRLMIVSFALIVALTVASSSKSQGVTTIATTLIGILSAFHAGMIVNWVQSGSLIEPVSSTAAEVDKARRASRPRGEPAVTALYVFLTNIAALVLVNLATATNLNIVEKLEKGALLHFSDEGFRQFQTYFNGLLIGVIWVPAIHICCFLIDGSKREIRYISFLMGTALAMILAVAMARDGGGLSDPTPALDALQIRKDGALGPDGLLILAYLLRLGAFVLITFCAATYCWLAACLARRIGNATARALQKFAR